MKTPFERIEDISKIGIPSKLNLDELFELASQETIYFVSEADKDLLLGIDLQFSFMEGGDHPEPFTTIITYEDVLNGKWIAANPENQEASLHYLKKLEMSKDKKKLCIWPVHAVPDTVG